MSTFSRISKILKASAVLGLSAVAFLLPNSNEEDEIDERRLHDSDLTGVFNYRTGRLDAGTDPRGWYDEDFD